jgi:hypothetical protein
VDETASHTGLSRRKVLSGLAVGAAASVVVAGPASATASRDVQANHGIEHDDNQNSGPAGKSNNGNKHTSFTLRSADVRMDNNGATFADLVDESGNAAGSFWSVNAAGAGAVLTFHTFELIDATLSGTGSGPLEEATFAVVGGTGSLLGAGGAYIARQDPVSAGGDGSAEFVFDLIFPKE